MKINVILFDEFEALDVFGPAELFSKMPNHYQLEYFSQRGGLIASSQGFSVQTAAFAEMDSSGILLVPGGMGTRKLISDTAFIDILRLLAEKAAYVLAVCTGSALLAKTGLLAGKRATTNKRAFPWAVSANDGEGVQWVVKARWLHDGKFYTSSGVSAGMDMTLGFIADLHGRETAERVASYVEYIWNSDPDNDPFTQSIPAAWPC